MRPTARRRAWGYRRTADSRCWDFAEFCALERGRGLRSAFNFAVVSREKGHLNDVRYNAGQPKYRRLMRELLADGWEVGLHAAYLTAQGRPPAWLQYERLAEWTGCQVRGVRHHYLQLQPDQPLATLLAHAEAGAADDSSMGFNDSPGFRAGTALPFEVFDPRRGLTGELLELPMSIADMHLPRDDERAATECVLGHLAVVRELGGLAVLNWHVGNWHPARGWRESYRAACELLAQDAGAWVAPPRRIAEWWRARSTFLDECSFVHRNLNEDMKLGIVRAVPAKSRTAVAC